MKANLWILSVVTLVFVACASSPSPRKFKYVQMGMPKYDVLELIGEPRRVERIKGRDVWTYYFPSRAGHVHVREVEFERGTVVYFGKRREVPKASEQPNNVPADLERTDPGGQMPPANDVPTDPTAERNPA